MLKDIISLKNKVELMNINKNKVIRKASLLKNYITLIKPMIKNEDFILNPSNILSLILMVTDNINTKQGYNISVKGQAFLILTLPEKMIELEIVDKDLISLNITSGESTYRTDIISNNTQNNNNLYVNKINKVNDLLKNQLNEIVVDYFFR